MDIAFLCFTSECTTNQKWLGPHEEYKKKKKIHSDIQYDNKFNSIC